MKNNEQKKIMVKKSNSLIHGANNFDNIWQGRIFSFICSNMPSILTDAELQKYQFKARDILMFAGKSKGKGKSQKEHLKKALMELQKKQFLSMKASCLNHIQYSRQCFMTK